MANDGPFGGQRSELGDDEPDAASAADGFDSAEDWSDTGLPDDDRESTGQEHRFHGRQARFHG
jgi:hypothetical protein